MQNRPNPNQGKPVTSLNKDLVNNKLVPLLPPKSVIALSSTCKFFRAAVSEDNRARALRGFLPYMLHLINPQDQLLNLSIKCVLLGGRDAQKSSLVSKYFPSEPGSSTIGVDFKVKNFVSGQSNLKVVLYDTAGQEDALRQAIALRIYLENSHIAICALNSRDKNMLGTAQAWLRKVSENNCLKAVIINNTTDDSANELSTAQVVSLRENLEAEFGPLMFCKTNSATGAGVHEAFRSLICAYLGSVSQGQRVLPLLPLQQEVNVDGEPINAQQTSSKCSIM